MARYCGAVSSHYLGTGCLVVARGNNVHPLGLLSACRPQELAQEQAQCLIELGGKPCVSGERWKARGVGWYVPLQQTRRRADA